MRTNIASQLFLEEKITVLVDIDSYPERLIKYAMKLAKYHGQNVHFIALSDTCSHPMNPYGWQYQSINHSYDNSFQPSLWEYASEVQKKMAERMKITERAVYRILEKEDPEVTFSVDPVLHSSVDDLIFDSVGAETSLLMMMRSSANEKNTEGQNAFIGRLLGSLDIPLFLLSPDSQDLVQPARKPRILLFDNLEESSLNMLLFAEKLVKKYEASEIFHTYFDDGKDIRGLRSVLADFDDLTYYRDNRHGWLIQSLAERSASLRKYVDQNDAHYEYWVEPISAPIGLRLVTDRIAPDLILFGRHVPFYWKELRFGNLPLTKMLAYKQNVCIVP